MTDKDKKEMGEIVSKSIANALVEFWEHVSPNLATKDDIKDLKHDIEKVASDVKDIRRRVIDLETDTVTRKEFLDLKQKLTN